VWGDPLFTSSRGFSHTIQAEDHDATHLSPALLCRQPLTKLLLYGEPRYWSLESNGINFPVLQGPILDVSEVMEAIITLRLKYFLYSSKRVDKPNSAVFGGFRNRFTSVCHLRFFQDR